MSVQDQAGAFVAWLAGSSQATEAEARKVAEELLTLAGGGPVEQSHVDGYCKKLKRGFAGARTIVAAGEVGEALLEWQRAGGGPPVGPVDAREDEWPSDEGALELGEQDGGALEWGDDDGGLLDDAPLEAGLEQDELPPLPEIDADRGALGRASFEEEGLGISLAERQRDLSMDEKVDSIGGRDVFAASDPPIGEISLDLDEDADVLGDGQEHYVREDKIYGGRDKEMKVDIDREGPISKDPVVLDGARALDADSGGADPALTDGVPQGRRSAAPVGLTSKPPRSSAPPPRSSVPPGSSHPPPRSSAPPGSQPPDGLPPIESAPPPSTRTIDPGVLLLAVVLLLVAVGAAVFAMK